MHKRIKIVIISLLVAAVFAFAAEAVKHAANLKKTAEDDPLLNRARAYLDKGKLKIAVENYGIFSGRIFIASAYFCSASRLFTRNS